MAAVALQFAVACLAIGAGDPPMPGWQSRVEALIRQLDDASFPKREAATHALLAQGEKIVPLLDKARKRANLETARRIDRIRYQLVGYADDLMRFLKHETLSDSNMSALIARHQPGSGNLLVELSAHRGHPLSRRAAHWFCETWTAAAPEQVDAYLKTGLRVHAKPRSRYPRSVAARFETGYALVHGWDGVPKDLSWQIGARHYIDGQLHGNPSISKDPRPTAVLASIDTSQLGLGTHTLRIELEYAFAHRGAQHRGSALPREFTFTIVPDDGDHLLAAPDAAVERAVRQGLTITEYDRVRFAPAVGLDVRFNTDRWEPQIIWEEAGKRRGLHMPEWSLQKPLPVDLCFDVSIRDVGSDKTYAGESLIVRKGQTGIGCFSPRELGAFCEGRSGFIDVEIHLTPSRTLALSNPEIARYFGGTIVSPPLRARVIEDVPHKSGL